MRLVHAAFVLLVAGCCVQPINCDFPDYEIADYGVPTDRRDAGPGDVSCVPRVVPGHACEYGVDGTCRGAGGHICRCQCSGFWSCDDTVLVCDSDGGPPGD